MFGTMFLVGNSSATSKASLYDKIVKKIFNRENFHFRETNIFTLYSIDLKTFIENRMRLEKIKNAFVLPPYSMWRIDEFFLSCYYVRT